MSRRRITQAVVVIHGIGEQRPMDTLRSFVEAVLPEREDGEKYFSKPDVMSETLELRKLQDRSQPRTHFYEYYWAYKVGGTSVSHLLGWVKSLLWRRLGRVPRHLTPLWGLSWFLLILAATGGLIYWIGSESTADESTLPLWVATLSTALLGAVQSAILSYLGDAARYLSPDPSNIALRQKIRADGIRLLRKLHESKQADGRPSYDRIVVVGHSLGSVIALDILTHLWQEMNRVYETPSGQPQSALAKVEHLGETLRKEASAAEIRAYQRAQTELWWELQELGNPWRVSDFISLGSPLAHAGLLLARDADDLAKRQRQRELPTCPPMGETTREGSSQYGFRVWEKYVDEEGKEHVLRALHHAGAFAATRWTNLYFRTRWGLFGDTSSGELAPVFGPGILDKEVTVKSWWRNSTPLAHHSYWLAPGEPAVEELITALDRSGERTYRDLVDASDLAEADAG